MAKRYWLETYGCQMNEAESVSLENSLQDEGWASASTPEEADLVLLNTCSVRKTAENRIWGRLGFFKSLKEEHKFSLGVMGCMTERLKDDLRKEVPEIDLLIGTYGKGDFLHGLKDESWHEKRNFFGHDEFSFARSHFGASDAQAMVPIMHGCNNFCTYCIVPYVRGREVSRTWEEIKSELTFLQAHNVKEITLLGQNVNSYFSHHQNDTLDFAGLLTLISEQFTIPWIRFLSSHPKDLSHKVIEAMKINPQICPHLHLPVQHGSNRILESMNRRYTRESYLRLVDDIRNAIPDISLTTDILIGFPGETEEDVEDTLDLIKTVGFSDAFTYIYNAMEGTKAFNMQGQISEKVKKERLNKVIDLQRQMGHREKESRVGKTVAVLVEGSSKKNSLEMLGRTEHNSMVVFPGTAAMTGTLRKIKLVGLSGNTYKGEDKGCLGN